MKIVGFNNESIEGDTMWDASSVIENLMPVSRDPKGEVWRKLVDAGVFTGLTFTVLNFGAMITKGDDGDMTQDEAEAHGQLLPSAWSIPIEIMLNASSFCGNTATPTEKKMIADLRAQWGDMMRRPMYSLLPNDNRAAERGRTAHLAMRLTVLDPSFLSELAKPSDLTLTVCFRNWMHATSSLDIAVNSTLICSFLDEQHIPRYWKSYLASHPLPSLRHLIPRIVRGATVYYVQPGPRERKRNPQQAAEAIVNAFVSHLSILPHTESSDLDSELSFFHALLLPSKEDYRALLKAVAESTTVWPALVQAMRRAYQLEAEHAYWTALQIFFSTLHPLDTQAEFADVVIAHWATSGFFDVLEDSADFLLEVAAGPMTFSFILGVIQEFISRLGTDTRLLLRQRFRFPKLSAKLVPSMQPTVRQQMAFMRGSGDTGRPRADDPMWRYVALEGLVKLTEEIKRLQG
uniref:N/A n=1 Tax=Ganoderma boninense TaxID=34458 RepID=A0A5K1K813_9APHY|nr:N/A [Ganoderma boninense]